MGLKVYMYETTPPVSSVLMTAAALGIQIEKVILNPGETRSPEFLKMNPQHIVPTLVDGDFVLWESHAINPYLVEKYGKDDWLYPKNLEKRGTVNQRLHLNNSTIYPTLHKAFQAAFEKKTTELPQEELDQVLDLYKLLETLLEKTRYIADTHVTVADFSIVASMMAADLMVPIDAAKYPQLFAWVERMKGLPCYRVNVSGFEEFKNAAKARIVG